MKQRPLGRTGVTVSELCLGSMTWGSQNTQQEADSQLDYARDHGINFIDSAEMYPTTPMTAETFGGSEAIIGNWLAKSGKRDKVIVATKITGKGSRFARGGAPIDGTAIRQSIEASLKRLKTDYIDLYQIHWSNRGSYHFRQAWNFDPTGQDTRQAEDDISDVLETADGLIREGKMRFLGLSNETAWGVMRYVNTAERNGWPRIVSIQNEYNLLQRTFDLDLAEACHHEGVGLMAWSPLAAGMLSGKYAGGKIPAGSRRSLNETLGGRWNDHSVPVNDRYVALARDNGLEPSQMALAWCLTRPAMMSTIIGATSLEQLKTNIAAADLVLSDTVMEGIAAIRRVYPMPM